MEELLSEESYKEIKQRLKEYRENEFGIRFIWKKKREKITQ
jgi:hypothetical protein